MNTSVLGFAAVTAALDPAALAQHPASAERPRPSTEPGDHGLQRLTESELLSLMPDFRIASYGDCVQRGGLVARGTQAAGGDSGILVFLTSEPLALDKQQWFETLFERLRPARLVRAVVSQDELDKCLRRAEGDVRALDGIHEKSVQNETQDADVLVLSLTSIESASSTTVRLINSTLYDALKSGASDIHFELDGKALNVKYRLDGVLQSIKRVDGADSAHQAISRIKVLSDLDISERRVPQDGRFRASLDEREVDFRVSIMPNAWGEDAVLRVLDRKHLTGQFKTLTLDSLSFAEDVKAFIRASSRLPYGLLLVTGPTGSGKTTTLYAAISEINTGLDKIVTIEDPIEYQLPGVLQIPVNEKKGLTFAKGLRSILRHDPDKIMVGEIRDSETAQIAVQASLTGHQVFTTVHANNVFDVIGRFSNMGVDSYSLVAALSGIVAQRLVRTLCPRCAQDHSGVGLPAPPDHLEGITSRVRISVGCEYCRNTGFKGRAAIAETLPLDDELKDLLLQHAPISVLKAKAREKGFRSLRDSGLALAWQGATTFEEVDRVTPAI
jgi:general secretion pathway protein E